MSVPRSIPTQLGASLLAIFSAACIHSSQVDTYIAQGRTAFNQADYEAADSFYRRAHKQASRQFGGDSLIVARISASLGATNENMGQFQESERFFRDALAIYEKSPETEPRVLALALNNLASSLLLQDKPVEAEQVLRRSLSIFDGLSTPDPFLRAIAISNLAESYLMQEKIQEAKSLYEESVRSLEEQKGAYHHLLAAPFFGLAMIAEKEDDLDGIDRLCPKAMELSKNMAGTRLLTERRAKCELLLRQNHGNEQAIRYQGNTQDSQQQ